MNRRQRRSLRIADLGYFDTLQFQKEDEAGEYWISRLKVGKSLLTFDEVGNLLDLHTLLSTYAGRTSYECKIQVSATRRVPARLIAFPVPEEVAIKRRKSQEQKAQKHGRKASKKLLDLCGWTLLITNIPPEELSHQEALVLLRARWQIELLFKLMITVWTSRYLPQQESLAPPLRLLRQTYRDDHRTLDDDRGLLANSKPKYG